MVVKGHTQQENINCKKTFSLVVKFASICLILAIIAHLDLELYQIDIKDAFLNEEMDKKIYMDQPIAFTLEGHEHKVCKLCKFIYDLK